MTMIPPSQRASTLPGRHIAAVADALRPMRCTCKCTCDRGQSERIRFYETSDDDYVRFILSKAITDPCRELTVRELAEVSGWQTAYDLFVFAGHQSKADQELQGSTKHKKLKAKAMKL